VNAHVEVVTNTSDRAARVFFEPWGLDCTLDPHQSLKLIFNCANPQLTIERSDDEIAVYVETSCSVDVVQDDGVIYGSLPPFPGTPPGLSVKGFINGLFGGPGEPRGKAT